MKSPVLVLGASGHARVVIDILEQTGAVDICGIIDSYKPVGTRCCDYAVLGTEHDIPRLSRQNGIRGIALGVGDNWIRSQIVERISAIVPGLPFVSAIHPGAIVGRDVAIGAGTVIMAGAVVNIGTNIGQCCIVNTHVGIDHDNSIGEFACILPGVHTGGNVTVGSFSAVCMGATIKHGIKIGQHAVIGAGSVVLSDIEDNVVAYGAPAKVIRKRNQGDRYL